MSSQMVLKPQQKIMAVERGFRSMSSQMVLKQKSMIG